MELKKREKLEARRDMIFCKDRVGHNGDIEYGAAEAGSLYEGTEGTKRLEEGSKKLPKVLKTCWTIYFE